MERRQNTRHLLRQWMLPAVLLLLPLMAVGWLLLHGKFWLVIIIVAIIGIQVGWIWYYSIAQVRRLLQSPTPQPLITYFEDRLGSDLIPDRVSVSAMSKGLVYTLYGQFEAARSEMSKVRWHQEPPFIQAQRVLLEAWWAYLERHDFEQGLALAIEARKLTDMPSSIPGARTSLSGYDAAIEIGHALTGRSDPKTVAEFDKNMKQLPILLRVLAAWGLEAFYLQSNQTEQAMKMRAKLTELGPHCHGLSKLM